MVRIAAPKALRHILSAEIPMSVMLICTVLRKQSRAFA